MGLYLNFLTFLRVQIEETQKVIILNLITYCHSYFNLTPSMQPPFSVTAAFPSFGLDRIFFGVFYKKEKDILTFVMYSPELIALVIIVLL